MFLPHRSPVYAAVLGLATATAAFAQVSSIDSVKVTPRVFNDVPGATFTQFNSYPTDVSFGESGVSASGGGFANRDEWQFSNNGGSTAYQFQGNDYFSASMTLTLTASSLTQRKEAGFLMTSPNFPGGDLQFFVDTDAHEVVQVGGVGFYSFNNSQGITYTAGTPITLGITYFLNTDGKAAFIFTANGVNSPVEEFASGNIGSTATLGGYFQIVNDPTDPNNSGTASFANIGITPVPEPSTLALAGLGLLPILLRRRQ